MKDQGPPLVYAVMTWKSVNDAFEVDIYLGFVIAVLAVVAIGYDYRTFWAKPRRD